MSLHSCATKDVQVDNSILDETGEEL